MIVGKVVHGVATVVRVVAGAGAHAAWWLDYRVRGRSGRD
jgi:hypothetical protein